MKDQGAQGIIDSIQNLKEEYKSLKEAYRELIQERLRNCHEIARIRTENKQLKLDNELHKREVDKISRENERFRMQLCFLQQENDRTRRECLKLLEVEKFKAQKLE